MGRVYRARDDDGAWAAIKVANLRRFSREALQREIAALERIAHPGIVRFLGHGEQDGELWVATEFVRGESLRTLLDLTIPGGASHDTVSLDELSLETVAPAATDRFCWSTDQLLPALALLRRVCDPLAWLHGEGLVHGDVKPENVLVRPDGSVVLVDLGLVRSFELGGRDTLATDRRATGTRGYLAPEQLRGEPVDGRADLYALGCVLFELLCGATPEALGHPSIAEVAEVPAGLQEIVDRLLAPRPSRRLSYATDLAEWLERFGVPAPPPGPPVRHALYRPSFTGRDALLGDLQPEGVVVLTGPPGVGKTRLLAGHAGPARVLAASAAFSRGLPVALAGALCAAAPRAGGETWFSGAPGVLAALDPRIAQWTGRSPEATTDARLVAALVDAVAAAAPAVVLIDDVAAAGPLDSALCRRLARRPPPGVQVWFAGSAGPVVDELVAAGARPVEVPPLDDGSIARIVAEILGDEALPPELAALVVERAAGNPWFAWELCHGLVEAGHLRRQDGRWIVRDRDRLEVAAPRGVAALAEARYRALDPPTRAALGRLVVGGLGVLSGDERASLLEARVVELTDGGVRPTVPGVAERAAAALSADERRAAHAAAVPLATTDEDLAAHLTGAGRDAEARVAWTRVLATATTHFRWPAVAAAAAALRALPGHDEVAEIRVRIQLAKAQRARGQFRDALETLGPVPDDLSTPDLREARFLRARSWARLGDPARAMVALEEALAADPEGAPLWLEALGETAYEQWALPESERWRRLAVAELERRQDPQGLARCQVGLANVLQQAGRAPEARALLERARPVLEAADNPLWVGHCEAVGSLASSSAEDGLGHATRAVEAYRRAGVVANECQALLTLSDALRQSGRVGEAAERLARATGLADEVGIPKLRGQLLLARSNLAFDRGVLAGIEVWIEEMDRIYRRGALLTTLRLARALRESGRWEEAQLRLDGLDRYADIDDVGAQLQEAVERLAHVRRAGQDEGPWARRLERALERRGELDPSDAAWVRSLDR